MNKAFVVCGLGFGGEGKGTIVDALVRQHNATLVCRHNGAAQCAHNVTSPDGRHHTFAQFGSGTLVPGVKTLLGPGVIINPLTLQVEESFLRNSGITDGFQRMFIDGHALVTTPFHIALNRLRELSRGKDAHGSCGMGVGETIDHYLRTSLGACAEESSIRASDLLTRVHLQKKLNQLRDYALAAIEELPLNMDDEQVKKEMKLFGMGDNFLLMRYDAFRQQVTILHNEHARDLLIGSDAVVFEGAQGVLLDQDYGFHPHTTWSTTTCTPAHHMMSLYGCQPAEVMSIGVVRTFMTRHGNGPMPTEDASLGGLIKDDDNHTGTWQGSFRAGYFDLPLFNYALKHAGVDCLAVTHVDKMRPFKKWKVATAHKPKMAVSAYDTLARQQRITKRLCVAKPVYTEIDSNINALGDLLRKPILIESHGKTCNEKVFRKLP